MTSAAAQSTVVSSSDSATPSLSLQEATSASTTKWQDDLHDLFVNARHRFPDVIWTTSNPETGDETDEVSGHKAIVYARAPPSFQNRYFQSQHRSYPNQSDAYLAGDASVTSLNGPDNYNGSLNNRSPSPVIQGSVMRLETDINPALFAHELEYLYTGRGFGEAFEFLFDTSGDSRMDEETGNDGPEFVDGDDARIDKLRKDLVFMWRSRLYSDVKIALTGTFSSANHESTTAIFSSHRFILVSRCGYFHDALIAWPGAKLSKAKAANNAAGDVDNDPEPTVLTLTLPSPPFTPASLHFILGYIYTGTLIFSHRSYDLDTAFAIYRSSTYLSLAALTNEIQARIVQEMLHGLFHAFLSFAQYEDITQGQWGDAGGCRCRQCARRAPRVLEFALALQEEGNPKNEILDRGARRALVGLYGEGWCTSEFAGLEKRLKESIVKGLAKRTTPLNVFRMLWAAEAALQRVGRTTEKDKWASEARIWILAGRKGIDECLANRAQECFDADVEGEWKDLMESDGVRFEDGDRVGWVMDSVKRGLNEKNAGMVYQTLVSSVLLRPHATEPTQAMLSSTSHIRVQVEESRMDVLQFIRKRWMSIKQAGGFDEMEGWSVKEVADFIDISPDEILGPGPAPGNTPSKKEVDSSARSVAASIRSAAPSVRSTASSMRSVGQRSLVPTFRSAMSGRSTVSRSSVAKSSVASSVGRSSIASSVRSRTPTSRIPLSPSTTRSRSRAGTPTRIRKERPDSKLSGIIPPPVVVVDGTESIDIDIDMEDDEDDVEAMNIKSTPTAAPPPSASLTVSPTQTDRRSLASSVTSATIVSNLSRPRSSASSTRSSITNSSVRSTISATRKAKPPSVRISTATTDSSRLSSATSGDFHTASAGTRSRRNSASSSRSVSTVRSTATATGRKITSPSPRRSLAPSVASSVSSRKSTTSSFRSPVSPKAPSITPSLRAPSVTSSVASRRVDKGKEKETPSPKPNAPIIVLKGKARAEASQRRADSGSTASAKQIPVPVLQPSAAANASPKRKTTTPTPTPEIKGAMLTIGIPCIITFRRKRFRALAKYIGEVEGHNGAWVGVEVPDGGSALAEGWNDGSWDGVRYFELGTGEVWDDGMGVKRRRIGTEDSRMSKGKASVIRAPTIEGVNRGLFVRPQQVLYVVDAIDGDL